MAKNSGQFVKGQSGNPSGRPRGIKERYSRYREMIEGDVEDILKMLVKKALDDGDITAARVLIDRVWPADAEYRVEQSETMKEILARIEQLESKK